MRRMARGATLTLKGCVFESEWALFVAMTLDTRSIGSDRQFGLLRLKSAVSVVAVAAFHRAFEHLVMKRLAELRPGFGMAANTQLRFALLEHGNGCDAGVLDGRLTDLSYRAWPIISKRAMGTVAIGTSDIIAPMFAAAEVVVAFFAGMAGKTRLRDLFGILAGERNDLCLIAAALYVQFAGPVA